MNIAICSRDEAILYKTEDIILQYCKKTGIRINIEAFNNGEELIDFIKNNNKFDIMFLSIDVKAGVILKNARFIREELDDYMSKIVFLNLHKFKLPDVYDLCPINVIESLEEKDKIYKSINIVKKCIASDDTIFAYNKKHTMIRVYYKDILYFESIKKQIRIVTNLKEDLFYGSMIDIRKKIPDYFVETHGSYLANVLNIFKIENNKISFKNDICIPVSQRRISQVRDAINKYSVVI